MKRRDLLAWGALSFVPSLARAQNAVTEYADFLKSPKYGLVVRPFKMLASDGTVYLNMYEASGALNGLGSRISRRLGDRLNRYVPELKLAILERLSSLGLPASDVPFNADAGWFSSPYGSKEPRYLDCLPFLSFAMLKDRTITPGVGIFSQLISPSAGQLDHLSVGLGFVHTEPRVEYIRIGFPEARFDSIQDIEENPDRPADTLVSLARPLGIAFAELFVEQVSKNRAS